MNEALAVRATRPSTSRPSSGPAPEPLWQNARDAEELPDPIAPSSLGLTDYTLRIPQMRGRAEGSLETALICLQRLSNRYRFPFPRETARAMLNDCESRLGGITLLHLGQLLESLGLEVRPLAAPTSSLHKLETPSLLKLDDRFVLVEEASARGLVLADPTDGIRKLSPAQLKQWGEGPFQLMLIRPAESSENDQLASRFDLSWFWEVIRPYRPQLLLIFIGGFVQKVLDTFFILLIMQIIDVVIITRDLDLLPPIIGLMGLLIAVKAVIALLQNVLTTDLSDRIDTSLGSQMVGHLFRLPMRFFDRRTVGDLSNRFNELRKVRAFLTGTVIDTAIDVLFIPLLAIILLSISPLMTAIVMMKVPLMFINTFFTSKAIKRLLSRRNRAWSKSQGFLVECLTAIRTVKTQNFATQARWQWLSRYRTFTGEDFKLSQMKTISREINVLIPKVVRVALILTGAVLAIRGEGSVGSIFVFMILGGSIASSMVSLSTVSDQYEEARAAMDSLGDVLSQKGEDSFANSTMLPLPSVTGRVDFEQVSFSYGLNGQRQMDHFDVSIEAGQVVGLVGTSGSGKSTLVQLLDGLYKPMKVGSSSMALTSARFVGSCAPTGLCAAGVDPVRRHGDGQLAPEYAGCALRRRGSGNHCGLRARFHHEPAGRLQHPGGRTRRRPFRRPEAANRHCPDGASEPKDDHSR